MGALGAGSEAEARGAATEEEMAAEARGAVTEEAMEAVAVVRVMEAAQVAAEGEGSAEMGSTRCGAAPK